GCYNAVAVIANVELQLADNVTVKRKQVKMKRAEYGSFFNAIKSDHHIIFHNGDIYPPHYKNVRAVSWIITDDKPTTKTRMMPLAAAYPIERYLIGAFAKNDVGKWRRE